MGEIKGVIFDLDGVVCDTARYHFLAWRRLAETLGIDFDEEDNERLKGVSREKSLDILLEIGNTTGTDSQKKEWADRKNRWYVEYISEMTKEDILPGVTDFFGHLHSKGIKMALGSASKNAGLILDRLQIKDQFDFVADGSMISRAKPDPEIFLTAARGLDLPAEECIVFEDAEAGVEAAHRAGMRCVGVGEAEQLKAADYRIKDFNEKSLYGGGLWNEE